MPRTDPVPSVVMGDVEVATDGLRALAGRLEQLSTDLSSRDARANYSTTELAHRSVVGAMEQFRENWDDNRDHLADKLSKLAELAARTADGFEEADAALAREVVKAMEGSA
jgi:uncharacterized protein YukE